MRITTIIVVIIGCVLGYGYWHSATHAAFHIQLDFKNNDKRAQKPLAKIGIDLLDAEGHVLAHGVSDEHYNHVHLIHPKVGDCHEAEQAATFSGKDKNAWQLCFEHLSTWIATWAGKVRQVNVDTGRCTWRNLPVTVSKSQPDWFLWWVPHPHIGGKPYTYYSLDIAMNNDKCENQT